MCARRAANIIVEEASEGLVSAYVRHLAHDDDAGLACV
jgi:hypothetical protein